ncbi:sugar phosphate isomerase/epimerase [Pusillimonas sp. MFBS29]|uniref:sugar phosphate isomerase/epimerase family protein n=1 Tax=Pusillimonas sp. MFBS29 TaxID=2886690 RepID=UPI001D109F44|nr:sugar phosphate isomerase/epimerase family protein [Pusillimonas sp. MFBS29]MCC2596758.1 sugar phosphate isomerase/epimerase [Pusillimonas sp. MFBS29]
MKLAYMYATPDVRHSKVTAIQGDIKPTLAKIRQVGYEGVELLVCDPARIDANALEDAANQEGLDVPAVCTGEVYGEAGLSFADADPERRQRAIDRMKAAMALAQRFGAAVNVGRLRGRYQDGVSPEQTLDWIARALAECAREYPDTRIVMEPVNHLYANCLMGTSDMLEFIDRVALPNVGIMLDMVHMLVEGEDIEKSLLQAQQRNCLWHFHVSDSERLPVGDGSYDIAAVFQALEKASYDQYVTVETFQIPDSGHAIQASFNALRPYFYST